MITKPSTKGRRGRSFSKSGTDTPTLKAEVTATIYLSPADQGATAGATAQGPSAAATGASATPPASSTSSSPSSPTPTAVATP